MTWTCYDEFYFSVAFTSLSLYIQQFEYKLKLYMFSKIILKFLKNSTHSQENIFYDDYIDHWLKSYINFTYSYIIAILQVCHCTV